MNQPQLYLLDAYALIFRAYYAFINRPIINSKGLNTSAIFGFTNSLLEILQRDNPSHIAVVFDPPSPTFRKEIYAEYKANREQTPEDIKRSIPYIKSIIEALGIPILEVNNFEADDVIGTIAKKAEKAGYFTYMVTPDKDYGQLVSDKIVIYKPRRSGNDIEILGVKDICEKYTISDPRQVIDILALWGDASDNIPGVPGIGEKTSIKLISHFGSIENLLQNVDQLKGKQKENVINSKEQLELSKKLVTIALDVPVEFEPEQLKYHGIDQSKLEPVLVGLEFNSIRSRLFNEASKQGLITSVPSPQQPQQGNLFGESTTDIEAVVTPSHLNTIKSVRHEYVLVDTEDSLNALIEKLGRLKEFCFDTETTSLDAASAELVGLAISYKKGEAFYVPFDADRVKARDRIELFRDLFANTSIRKVGQNLKYDIQVLANYNIHVEGPLFDTMIAHYLIQPELK
ncbi:MAG: 5'-3' exonuclease H3TH domain-containing protein, partial [Cyclobacteriaceae bacterium]